MYEFSLIGDRLKIVTPNGNVFFPIALKVSSDLSTNTVLLKDNRVVTLRIHFDNIQNKLGASNIEEWITNANNANYF